MRRVEDGAGGMDEGWEEGGIGEGWEERMDEGWEKEGWMKDERENG